MWVTTSPAEIKKIEAENDAYCDYEKTRGEEWWDHHWGRMNGICLCDNQRKPYKCIISFFSNCGHAEHMFTTLKFNIDEWECLTLVERERLDNEIVNN